MGNQGTDMCIENRRKHLVPYDPPKWAAHLKGIPRFRVHLSNNNTPIQRWHLPGVPEGFEVYIKREDMSGAALSGNKIKKLEFLLADAIDKDCSSVVTTGSVVSNHCRCTALAARQLGLQPYLVLRSPVSNGDELVCSGNTLLYRMAGAQMFLVPPTADVFTELLPRVHKLADALQKYKNEKTYPIYLGGSSGVGLFGCIDSYRELIEQDVENRFTDIALATGSCGNTTGLAIGNYLTGSKLKIHGLCIKNDLEYTTREVNRLLEEVGLRDANPGSSSTLSAEQLIDVIEGAFGLGYRLSSPEELDYICKVATTTGIVLDPTYTGKAAMHLVKQLQDNPNRFKGKQILFIHTGGIFGLFDGRMDSVLRDGSIDNIHPWMDLRQDVPLPSTSEAI